MLEEANRTLKARSSSPKLKPRFHVRNCIRPRSEGLQHEWNRFCHKGSTGWVTQRRTQIPHHTRCYPRRTPKVKAIARREHTSIGSTFYTELRTHMLFRCSEMTSNAGKATTMDGYPVPSFPKGYVLERQWREMALYDL